MGGIVGKKAGFRYVRRVLNADREMSELQKYILSYFGVTHSEAEKIEGLFRPVEIKKGEFYLHSGGSSRRLGFVQSGILREYLEVGEKEVTKWISTGGYFAVDLQSFLFDQPARWNIQALADAEVWAMDKHDYLHIAKQVPDWPRLEKLFIARCFTALEDRIVDLLALDARQRYEVFFSQRRELLNLVPLQYLASMLGMTPETFSRIRKKQAR